VRIRIVRGLKKMDAAAAPAMQGISINFRGGLVL
jgi:hypothetical protein